MLVWRCDGGTSWPRPGNSRRFLAADVVGYSRLAGSDEDRTLARLRALRSDLIDPTVAVHQRAGREAHRRRKLIEFRSVVDAVRCAIEVQNGMVERNAGLPPERRIEFRVGIHLGDVVEESDGDLMGDGVNIAARLEGIAKPGAICLSEDAYRQVKSRLDLAVSDLGPTKLKNIAEPIRVYSLEIRRTCPAKLAPQAEPLRQKSQRGSRFPDNPSIAVLPFQNMSGDPEQDYFADGMVEDIITGLSRIKWLFVIARNSTFTYKGRAVDVKQVVASSACAMCSRAACASQLIACASLDNWSMLQMELMSGPSASMARPRYLRASRRNNVVSCRRNRAEPALGRSRACKTQAPGQSRCL